MQDRVSTDSVNRATDACDSECAQKRPVEFPQTQHTERNTDIGVVRQHHASVIQTVHETAEVPQRLQLDVPMNTKSRSGRWLMIKMVTQTTSRVSDAEVINGDADDSKGMVAHDT